MPNHIINTIRLTGDREKISELLESVKDNRFGIGSLDFNKVIPMPESLQIETSSSMERGLKAYKEFVESALLMAQIRIWTYLISRMTRKTFFFVCAKMSREKTGNSAVRLSAMK
ncbi:MAG: hypothetical protein ACLR56_04300 [Oscillospiraceae bacterium]